MSHEHKDRQRRVPAWVWWVGGAVVIVVLIVLASARPPQVEVATARTGDLTVTVTATGEVEGRVANVSPTIQGRVEAVYRDEGDWVNRGDLLCRLTSSPGVPTDDAALTAAESITAPFDGVVSRRHVDPGDAALPGQPLFQVADASQTWIAALVDDIDIGKVSVGQEAEVSLPAYLGKSIRGQITQISATAEPRTAMGTGGKIVRARVELTEPASFLRPGMEVDVKTESVVARGVVLIPADAVIENEAERWVFVVRDGRVRKTTVQVGANNYLEVAITSGVSSGDAVVVGGKEDLKDGQRVRTTEASSQ